MKHRVVMIAVLCVLAVGSRGMLAITIDPGIHHEQIKITDPGDDAVISLTGVTLLANENAKTQFNGPHIAHGADDEPSGEKYPFAVNGSGNNVTINDGRITDNDASHDKLLWS